MLWPIHKFDYFWYGLLTYSTCKICGLLEHPSKIMTDGAKKSADCTSR